MEIFVLSSLVLCSPILATVTLARNAAPTDCSSGWRTGCTIAPNQDQQGVLHMQNAKIVRLPVGVFRGYSHVRVLDVSQNNISVIQPGAFVGMVSLDKLHLNSNSLEIINFTTFAGAEKIRYLNLARNKIYAIEPGSFAGLRRLMLLNLNINKLTSIPADVFDSLPHLGQLCLDGNRITTIAPLAFQNLNKLKILRLNSNRLETIPDIFSDVLHLSRLGLSRNRFQCDCRLELFRKWIAAHGTLITSIIHSPVRCTGPSNMSGRDLRHVTSVLTCTRPFISQMPKKLTLFEGDNKVMRPLVKGQPTPTLTWRNPSGVPIPTARSNAEIGETIASRQVVVNREGALVISRAAVSDSGVYSFSAQNIAGSFSGELSVTVQKKKYLTTVDITTSDHEHLFERSVVAKHVDKSEERHDVMYGCQFNPVISYFSGILLTCILTFLSTSLLLSMIFCCYHKRALARSKTYFGEVKPVSERTRMKNVKSVFLESGSSLFSAVTRMSSLSFGSEMDSMPRDYTRRKNLNSYCSGSVSTATQRSVSIETNDNDSGNTNGINTYANPYEKDSIRKSDLPPTPQATEHSDPEGYMVPAKSKLRSGHLRTYQNSTLCSYDPTYATIDPVASRHS
ncbi:Leucine-rich repeat and fibronectin type-III domain-containing protein 5 [Holothuria leucospilota]|uniref:Leucine-rich repeat and fibronectin type-III domain-containing protein 5 n=1 Tax=Holothuria leucospilota TaxID=206669 RepID=A0A9Q0YFQ0_HOLLE|nr:Leucine-rich repeat and fibronectin type-III domain-containing protein 5 [Holothuria leucospilota]